MKLGVSPRGSLSLANMAKANAYVEGRNFVTPEDVIEMAKLTLPHRIMLTTEARISHFTGYQVLISVLDKVKRPV